MSDPWAFGWTQLFSLINVLAVVAGLLLALWGIQKWRIDQIGKRLCELAEDALALAYDAQDRFDYVRSPAGFLGEGSSRKGDPNESNEKRQALNQRFVPIERLNSQSEFFSRVVNLRPRFKAIFGANSSTPLEEILKIRNEIIVAARMLSHFVDSPSLEMSDKLRKDRAERTRKYEAVIWKGSTEPDEIDARLASLCRQLDDSLAPILRSRYRS